MTMKGYRKVVMVGLIGAIVAFKDTITAEQIQLLQLLIAAAFGGNAVEHVAEGVKNGIRVRSGDGAVRAVRPVSAPAQAPRH